MPPLADSPKATEVTRARPYFNGGKQDLEDRGLDLSQCYNVALQHPRPLTEEETEIIAKPWIEFYDVLSSNAKNPKPCRLKWAWVHVPTGDAQPIRCKPYTCPAAYVDAVAKEIDGLCKAGLITPGYSDWLSLIHI